jgi:hypothetical protein
MENIKTKYKYLCLIALYWPNEKHTKGYDDILDGSAIKACTAFFDMLYETEKISYMINSSFLLDDAAKQSLALNLVYYFYSKTLRVAELEKSKVDRTFNVTIEKDAKNTKIIIVPRIIYLDYKDSEIVELINSILYTALTYTLNPVDITEVISLYQLVSNIR